MAFSQSRRKYRPFDELAQKRGNQWPAKYVTLNGFDPKMLHLIKLRQRLNTFGYALEP